MSVLDQLIAGSDEGGLRYDRAIALLGFTDDRLLDEVVEAFAADDGAAVFHAIDHVVEAGHDPRRFAADLLDRLRDLIVLLAVPDAGSSGLIEAPADRVEQMRAQAGKLGQAGLTRAAEVISAGLVEMRGATSPRLLLELMCAQVLLPAASAGDGALADRLDRLERRLAGQPGGGPSASAGPGARPVTGGTAGADSAPATAPQASRRPVRPEPESRQPAPRPPAENGHAASVPPPAAAPPSASPGAVDTAALRARWPEVLAAVQRERRVAWMQLSNASVESFADGVLTLAFAQAGVARGFLTGGYDKDLTKALSALFGITPRIATTLGGPGGPRSADAGPGPSDPRPPASPATGPSSPGNPERAQPRQPSGGNGGSRRPDAASAAPPSPLRPDEDTDPGDQAAPEALTGMDLIARELGGRVIEEIG
jgi:DNA polymerase-3 subunit gamma/tau